MNLITDPWIPVQRKSGALDYIAVWQITEPDNPVIKLAAPRHDFDAAIVQFLIGLLQTTATPADNRQWGAWLSNPPSPDELRSKFKAYEDVFMLDGEGPRFMQDSEPFEGEEKPISGLLIEAPGNRTSTLFLDHFIKEGSYNGLCHCCTATALFALQTNAPSGGVGHRTSLRGGGPLTTLLIPDTQANAKHSDTLPDTLWTTLWLNVLEQKSVNCFSGSIELNKHKDIFPWMADTRTSEAKTGSATTPENAHPFQMYWAMPRRIRIDWNAEQQGVCDLCGAENQSLVVHYITKNYGVNYTGAWQHPLSPHYQDKTSGERLPMHAQPAGLVYRYWLAWAQGGRQYLAAKVIDEYKPEKGRRLENEQLRLWVFGYDMDNMKARCWYEKQYPLIVIEDQQQRKIFCIRAEEMLGLATQMSGFVQSCVKDAWFDRPADARGDTSFIKVAFFEQTEPVFLELLNDLKDRVMTNEGRTVLQNWHARLTHHALKLFDHWAARGDITPSDPRRIAEAHRKLRNLIYGKKLLQSLGIETKKEKAA